MGGIDIKALPAGREEDEATAAAKAAAALAAAQLPLAGEAGAAAGGEARGAAAVAGEPRFALEDAPALAGAIPRPLAYNPQKVLWWYERLADWMLQNPDKYIKDAAVAFDASPSYLYTLYNSDTFQDYYQKRSRLICASVEHKARTLADRLLDTFQQDLDQADAMLIPLPVNQRLQILDMTMKRFGYGEKRHPPGLMPPGSVGGTTVNVNQLGVVSADELSAARGRLRESQRSRRVLMPSEVGVVAEIEEELDPS